MGTQYSYQAWVQVRPRGADGVFDTRDFDVVLPAPTATAGQVFDAWYSKMGDTLEPGAVIRINGEFTHGMGVNYLFGGREMRHAETE
jgi:hypothetical protein